MESHFKASFPTAFAPEYNRDITKRMNPLKDPNRLPFCFQKLAQETGPISPPPR